MPRHQTLGEYDCPIDKEREEWSEGAMKNILVIGVVLACSVTLFGCVSEQQATKGESAQVAPLTMNDVTALSKAGVSDSVIVSMINVSGSQFHLKPGDVVALADSGVSDNVIQAMIKTPETSKKAEQPQIVYASPWYPYYWDPYYPFDPFWDPWYYPGYSVRLGYYGGFGGHGFYRGDRDHRSFARR
jgi:hypothetical protein